MLSVRFIPEEFEILIPMLLLEIFSLLTSIACEDKILSPFAELSKIKLPVKFRTLLFFIETPTELLFILLFADVIL